MRTFSAEAVLRFASTVLWTITLRLLFVALVLAGVPVALALFITLAHASVFFGNPGFKVDPDASSAPGFLSSELELGEVYTSPCGAGSDDTITTGAMVYDSVVTLGTVANGDWCTLTAQTDSELEVRVTHDSETVKFVLDLGDIVQTVPAWPAGSQELHLDLNVADWLTADLLDDVTPNGLVIDSSHADYSDVLAEAEDAIKLVALP